LFSIFRYEFQLREDIRLGAAEAVAEEAVEGDGDDPEDKEREGENSEDEAQG